MGFRGKHKNKRDDNEQGIFETLRKFGLSVEPMDAPCDAIVGYGGRTYLVEVKTPKGKLTGPQLLFIERHKGCFTILRSGAEAEAFARQIRASTFPESGDNFVTVGVV